MKINKKVLIFIILAATGCFIWGIFYKSAEPKPETKSEQAPVTSINKTNETPPFSQEKQIYMPSDETVPLFFENVYKTAKTAETKLQSGIDAVTRIVPTAPSNAKIATSTPNEIILSLTNDEFHFLYPDSFIKSLIDAQDVFVKNMDMSYEPVLKIETDAQVRLIEEKIVDALVSLNMLTEKEQERAIITIRYTLPRLQLLDLQLRNRVSWNRYFNFPIPEQPSPKKLFLAGLVEMLRNALAPNAQAAYCGACWNQPECFQIGSSSPTPGANIFKAFCQCTGCYYGQGCLESCSGGSAIFDLTNFICGCGY
ncbi:MAG: hypothetical protein ABIG73_02090 [Patescibacteria group bacterium]